MQKRLSGLKSVWGVLGPNNKRVQNIFERRIVEGDGEEERGREGGIRMGIGWLGTRVCGCC